MPSNRCALEDSWAPWKAGRSNQSILKEINPEYSLGRLMLKLKLETWCQHLTHWKRPWCWERMGAGEEGVRGWDGWMASLIQQTWTRANCRRWWGRGKPGAVHGIAKGWTQLGNWTTIKPAANLTTKTNKQHS